MRENSTKYNWYFGQGAITYTKHRINCHYNVVNNVFQFDDDKHLLPKIIYINVDNITSVDQYFNIINSLRTDNFIIEANLKRVNQLHVQQINFVSSLNPEDIFDDYTNSIKQTIIKLFNLIDMRSINVRKKRSKNKSTVSLEYDPEYIYEYGFEEEQEESEIGQPEFNLNQSMMDLNQSVMYLDEYDDYSDGDLSDGDFIVRVQENEASI